MDCSEAIDNFDNSSAGFAATVGSYVDDAPDVSTGDVVESGISYVSDYAAMDTACDTDGGSSDSGE